MLRVGGEAQVDETEVGVEHVATLDDARFRRGTRCDPALAVDGDRRVKPMAETHVGDSLAHPPGEVLARRHARLNDRVRKRFGDDPVRHRHHVPVGRGLFGNLRLEPADREHLGRLHARRVLGPERLQQLLLLVGRQAVSMVPRLRRVDADDLGIALLDELAQAGPLLIVAGRDDFVQPVVVEASDREAIDGAASFAEHEDRAPARRVGRQAAPWSETPGRRCIRATR